MTYCRKTGKGSGGSWVYSPSTFQQQRGAPTALFCLITSLKWECVALCILASVACDHSKHIISFYNRTYSSKD